MFSNWQCQNKPEGHMSRVGYCAVSLTVGAVYDRSLLLESSKKRAVIDRAYSGMNTHTQFLCKSVALLLGAADE